MAYTASALSIMLSGFAKVRSHGLQVVQRRHSEGTPFPFFLFFRHIGLSLSSDEPDGMCSGPQPIIMTGSQLPLLMPRSDARQNLIDSITVATAGFSHPYVHLNELAVCFGGVLMRGNRYAPPVASPPPALTSSRSPPAARWRCA